MTLKKFTETILNIDYTSLFTTLKTKNLKPKIDTVFKNYKNGKTFECDEVKLLKIITAFTNHANRKLIETLCKHTSTEEWDDIDLVNLDEIEINEKTISKEIKSIKAYYSTYKKDDFFPVIFLLLNALLINADRLEDVLKDNKITLEKINCLSDREIIYASKKPILLKILKKTPLEALEKIKQKFSKTG